ncbi:hypothetical protein [Chryseobacterium sp. POE27]|uniref:hypothetical protein n=1 Tax=Chryseobacterium sp. POE27 TaxID=3138177 RepID=UPI00321A2D7A
MKKVIIAYCFLTLISCKGQRDEASFTITKTQNNKKTKSLTNISYKNIIFEEIKCSTTFGDNYYKSSCKNIEVYNNVLKASDNNKYELITIKFKDIDKAIIRKLINEELSTSDVFIYSNKSDNSLILFLPLVGEFNFGWKIYYFKDKILYPLGQRITYWKPEYEESEIKYKDFIKIYKSNDAVTVEIPSKYIINKNEDYQNYPNFLEGNFYEKNDISYYEFSLSNLNYCKKYNNGEIEGDYNKMVNNKIIDFIK